MCITELIPWLKFAISLWITLYRVICQMDKQIIYIAHRVVLWAGPQITFIIPIETRLSSNCHSDHVSSDVEFTSLVQEKILNVWLDDELGVLPVCKDLFADGLKTCVNCNSLPSVRVLGRFEDPDGFVRWIFRKGWKLCDMKMLEPKFVQFLEVICLRNKLKQLLGFVNEFKIGFEVVKKSILIAEHVIVAIMVMDFFRGWKLSEWRLKFWGFYL